MRRVSSRRLAITAVAITASLLSAAAAAATDLELLTAVREQLPQARAAGANALEGLAGADAVQRQYDAARDLEEALSAALPVSRSCAPLLKAARNYARGEVMQAEGFDRRSTGVAERGREKARAALLRVEEVNPRCRPGRPTREKTTPALVRPRSGEAFFGRIVARVADGASSATLLVDGRVVETASANGSRVSFFLRAPAGRHDLEVRFGGLPPARAARASSVWLLPVTGQYAHAPSRVDRPLQRRIARVTAGFGGYAGVWYHDLREGSTAAHAATARFPAASTVKLGVLIAGLRRFGPSPERSRYGYDLAQMIRWSSNLATNRLVSALGGGSSVTGARVAQAALHQAGATLSTFTGPYRAGTSTTHAEGSGGSPPLVSARVTTARDLGRVLALLHNAAVGDRQAQRRARISQHEARIALGYLLSSQAAGDNLGLIRPAVPTETSVARKEGWLSDARHSASIIYTASGPIILVLLTYQDGLSLSQARDLAQRLVRSFGLGQR